MRRYRTQTNWILIGRPWARLLSPDVLSINGLRKRIPFMFLPPSFCLSLFAPQPTASTLEKEGRKMGAEKLLSHGSPGLFHGYLR
jgi:hypothetical protein